MNVEKKLLQNPFEFSRQQENDQFKKPEIAQFRTSQQLINPNQMQQNFGDLMNQGNFQQQLPQNSGGSSV
uniref:Uncharacterized protein n=1 Tax=Panagrolaimus sp. PS1159 TaxID=55785 RepID=A0AC35F4G6_9BILA